MTNSPEDYPGRIGLLFLEETAYLMGLAASTIRKWRYTGRLPAACVVRVSPRKYMYIETEIIKAMGQGDVYNSKLHRAAKR